MTSLLSAEDKAKVSLVSRIELPSNLLAEVDDVRSLGYELSAAANALEESKTRLAEAAQIPVYKFWRRGEKDQALFASLNSMQEFQKVTAKLGAYNLWLSHKILETEGVLKGQNDRIEMAQHEIGDKVFEVDVMLEKFRCEMAQVSGELLRYLRDAERERKELAEFSGRAQKLLDEYAEPAAGSSPDHIWLIAELNSAMKAGFAQVRSDMECRAEKISTAARAQSAAVDGLAERMEANGREVTEKIATLRGDLERNAEEASSAARAQSAAVDGLVKRMEADGHETSAKIGALWDDLKRVSRWAQQFNRVTQLKFKSVDASITDNALALGTKFDAVQSQLDSDLSRRFKTLSKAIGLSIGLGLLACSGTIATMWFFASS